MQKYSILVILSLVLLLMFSTALADELGLYERYSVAPNVGETIEYSGDGRLIKVDKNYGYYVDGRGQVPEHARIAPPHEENIPDMPNPTRTVENFEKYYEINKMGLRRNPAMEQWVPNYNWHYSDRRAKPYTKEQFVNIWCSGDKFVNGVDCLTEDYAITFVRARDWSYGTIKAPLKARKTGRKAALFLMVDDLGLDATVMQDAKKWSKMSKLKIFYGTVDSFIPEEWIP